MPASFLRWYPYFPLHFLHSRDHRRVGEVTTKARDAEAGVYRVDDDGGKPFLKGAHEEDVKHYKETVRIAMCVPEPLSGGLLLLSG